MNGTDSFGTRTQTTLGGESVEIFSLKALERAGFPQVGSLPFSLKILLENLLRHEDARFVTPEQIKGVAEWRPKSSVLQEISFAPARVLLQDFTGVPCVVDLAAMRDGIVRLAGNPDRVNPLQPVELVIDHSVQVDYFGRPDAFELNADLEFVRNRERYAFLRWGQEAFGNFRVVPPDTGIVHQINIDLARVIFREVWTDACAPSRHCGWHRLAHHHGERPGCAGVGRGRIEAEAAMLGQPMSMLVPPVLGFKLTRDPCRGRDRDRSC